MENIQPVFHGYGGRDREITKDLSAQRSSSDTIVTQKITGMDQNARVIGLVLQAFLNVGW
jgi:hypothetical protein